MKERLTDYLFMLGAVVGVLWITYVILDTLITYEEPECSYSDIRGN